MNLYPDLTVQTPQETLSPEEGKLEWKESCTEGRSSSGESNSNDGLEVDSKDSTS